MAENSKNYYMEEKIGDSGVASTRNPLYIKRDYNPFTYKPRNVNVGQYFDKDSKYDKYLGDVEEAVNSGLTVDDLRARAQYNSERTGNALVNNLVIAGTTAVGGPLSLVAGIFEAAGSGEVSKLWDNSVSNLMADVQKATSDSFSIYRGNEYQNKSLWQQLGTGIFWADIIQNLGYTEGMLVPGSLLSKALTTSPKVVAMGLPSLVSAISEASTEAVNAKNDEINNKTELANQRYNELASKAQSQFAIGKLDSEYRKTLSDIENDAIKAGNFVYGSNIALLTASNALQFGKLFTRGMGTAKRIKGAIKRKGDEYVVSSLPVTMAKELGKKTLDAVSEGFEEVSQSVISNTPSNTLDYNTFNESKFNPEKRELAADIWSALGKTYAEAMHDKETANEFASGFIIGALGVPVLKKSKFPIGLENNIAVEMYQAKKQWEREKRLVDEINNRIQNNPELKAYYDGLVRHLAMQDRMNAALDNDDVYEYKNAEAAQFISDIMMFDKIGDLQRLKDIINNSVDLSDSGIDAIIQETSKNGEGPFMSNGNPYSREEVRTFLKERIDLLNSKVDNYARDKQTLEQVYPNIDEATLSNAVFLKSQFRDHSERFNQLLSETFSSVTKLTESSKFNSSKSKNPIKEGEGIYITTSDGKKKLVRKEDIDYYEPDGTPVFKEAVTEEDKYIFASKEDFYNKLRSSKEYRDFLTKLLTDENSTVPIDERESIAQSLSDLNKLEKNILNINKSLTEILLNPNKSKEDLKKTEEKVEKDKEVKEKNKRKDSISKASSYNEIQDLLDKEEITEEDLSENSTDVVKDYKKAKNFMAELYAAIDASEVSDEEKEALKQIADIRFKTEANSEDLMNEDLITEEDRVTDSGVVVLGARLSDYISLAKDKTNAREYTVEKEKGVPTEDKKVDKETVGKSEVTRTPSSTVTVFGKLKDAISKIKTKDGRQDKEGIELLLRLVDTLEDRMNNYLKTSEDKFYYSALEALNNIYSSLNNLAGYYEQENVASVTPILTEIEHLFPSASTISEDELKGDNSNLDEKEEASKMMEGKSFSFYRSDLTKYNVQSIYDGKFTPYEPENPAVKEAQNLIEYSYVDEGNIKVGDEITLRNKSIQGYSFIEMVHTDSSGIEHIVGFLPSVTNSKYQGIRYIQDKLKENKEPVKVTVSQIMKGGYRYDLSKSTSIKDMVNKPTNVKFGVVKPVSGKPTLITNSDVKTERVYDINSSDGNVYILLPNNKGTLSPKKVKTKHFNKEEFNLEVLKDSGNSRAEKIHKLITDLSNITESNQDDILDILQDLLKTLNVGSNFHIFLSRMKGKSDMYENLVLTLNSSIGRKNIILVRDLSTPGSGIIDDSGNFISNTEAKEVDKKEIYNEVLNYLYQLNPSFAVKASEINKGDYNDKLINDDILYSYITDGKMEGGWFTTDYYTPAGEKMEATKLSGSFTPRTPSAKSFIIYKGKQYGTNKEGKLIDANQNIVSESTENYNLILDLVNAYNAVGNKRNGINLSNGQFLINDSKGERGIDLFKQSYLTEEQLRELKRRLEGRPTSSAALEQVQGQIIRDQSRVKRNPDGSPDLSSNNYIIKEEDGSIKEYSTVDSIIEDNYGSLPGSYIEQLSIRKICKEFFSGKDINDIEKPAKMSESAFGNLKNNLVSLKTLLDNNGDRIYTNVVVYGQLDNGQRVAQEVDVLALNPITGEINIYSIATSSVGFNNYSTEKNKNGKSVKELYTMKSNAIRQILQSQYPSVKIGVQALIPVNYTIKPGRSIESAKLEKGISIETSDVTGLKIIQTNPVTSPKSSSETPASTETASSSSDTTEVKDFNFSNKYAKGVQYITKKDDNFLEVVNVNKRGKSNKGGYTITTDEYGFVHMKSINSVRVRVIPDNFGLSEEDIIGKEEEYNSHSGYQDTLDNLRDEIQYIDKITVRPNGEVAIDVANGVPIEGKAAKIIYDKLFGITESSTPENKSDIDMPTSSSTTSSSPDLDALLNSIGDLNATNKSEGFDPASKLDSENNSVSSGISPSFEMKDTLFDDLDNSSKEIITKRGLSKEQFNKLSPIEKNNILNCG